MKRKGAKEQEERCPKCGCPELINTGRMVLGGFRMLTSCMACSHVITTAPSGAVDEPDRTRGMLAAEQRLIVSMRAALMTFDRADPERADRHAADCQCAFCRYLRSCRELVADYDGIAPVTVGPPRCPTHGAELWNGVAFKCRCRYVAPKP